MPDRHGKDAERDQWGQGRDPHPSPESPASIPQGPSPHELSSFDPLSCPISEAGVIVPVPMRVKGDPGLGAGWRPGSVMGGAGKVKPPIPLDWHSGVRWPQDPATEGAGRDRKVQIRASTGRTKTKKEPPAGTRRLSRKARAGDPRLSSLVGEECIRRGAVMSRPECVPKARLPKGEVALGEPHPLARR